MKQLLILAGFLYKGHDYSSLRFFLLKILDFSFVFTCYFVNKCNKLINKLERVTECSNNVGFQVVVEKIQT